MGLFGATKNITKQSTNTRVDPYAAAKPGLDKAGSIINSYLANPKSNDVYSGPRVASLSGDTQAGLDLLRASTGANTSSDWLTQLLGTGAGGNNPAVKQMQDAVSRDVMANINATFSGAGMTGGTLHQGMLSKGLADGLAQPLFASYENDMSRKMQAAGMLPNIDQQIIANRMGAGEVVDSYNQSKIDANKAAFEEKRDARIRPLLTAAPALGALAGAGQTQQGTTTGTTSTKTPLGDKILGGGMMLGSLFTGGAPGMFGQAATGVSNVSKGAPWSYGNSWAPWTQRA